MPKTQAKALEDMMERGPIPAHMVANRVCTHLPAGYELSVHMEYGAAWVELFHDGDKVQLPELDDASIDEQINHALCAACGWPVA